MTTMFFIFRIFIVFSNLPVLFIGIFFIHMVLGFSFVFIIILGILPLWFLSDSSFMRSSWSSKTVFNSFVVSYSGLFPLSFSIFHSSLVRFYLWGDLIWPGEVVCLRRR